jgi:hypothetical protein
VFELPVPAVYVVLAEAPLPVNVQPFGAALLVAELANVSKF